MDLESLASLIDALAWPVIVIVGLLLFQKPLRLWLKERPQRLKVGPFEAEWASAAARTQVALESESELVGPPSSASNASWGSVDSPAAAIIHESTSLEVTLRRALQEAGVEDESLGLAALAKQAADASLIDVRTATALEGIATMRNLAVHSPGRITAEQAAQFAELAQSTASVVEAQERLARNMSAGAGNINPDDVATIVQADGPTRLVAEALQSNSPVKQRQTATALLQHGYIAAALDIACQIPNRSEARTVGIAVLDYISGLPAEQQQEGLSELERLRFRLRPPQLRDMRDHAQKVGVTLPVGWMEAPTN